MVSCGHPWRSGRGAIVDPDAGATNTVGTGEKKDLARLGKGLACNVAIADRAGNAKNNPRSVMTTMP